MGGTTPALRPLNADQLAVGMKLTGHLYNERGRILKRAGSVLTAEHIQMLASQNLMVDDDWRAEPEPAAPVGSADSATFPATLAPQEERRAHPRHPWHAVLRISIDEPNAASADSHQCRAKVNGLSRSGFSFIHREPVSIGSRVWVRLDGLPDSPLITGLVRNCVRIGDGVHRVGVEMVSTSRSEPVGSDILAESADSS